MQRELKRKKLVLKYAKSVRKYLNQLKNAESLRRNFELNEKIQKLPRNSSKLEFVIVVGKQDDHMDTYVISVYVEMLVREMSHDCLLPGVTKASW